MKRVKAKPPTEQTVDGVLHNVCQHYVTWWYHVPSNREITDDMRTHLEEEAEERAKHCIIEGYDSGELNCLYVFDDGTDEELRGWWAIERD